MTATKMIRVQQSVRNITHTLSDAYKSFRGEEKYKLRIGDFGGFAVAYRSDTADEKVIGHSFGRDIFFSAVPDYVPAEDHTIIDVGAHIGTFTLLAASKVRKVFAIEASRDTFEFLRINVCLNRSDNVTVSNLALSGSSGQGYLYHDKGAGNWGHTLMAPLSGSGEVVNTQSLADYLQAHDVASVNFIKFNCEGAEFPILMGAEPGTLAKIDRMMILYHCDLVEKYSLPSLLSHLERSGFATRVVDTSFNRLRGTILASRVG